MNGFISPGFLLALAALGAAGCGRKAETGGHAETAEHGKAEGKEHDEGGEAGVAFKPGRGLAFTPEIVKAMSLTTVPATERPLKPEAKVTAQVFALKPHILASASMPEAEAKPIESHPFQGAKIVRVERATVKANRLVDVIFALERDPAPALGEFVTLQVGADVATALAVPASAVLDAATGTFVYVVNGEYYLRTPVKLGVNAGDFIEITDGLYAGDIVVAQPVNQLWLAELRLTKGGGHSH